MSTPGADGGTGAHGTGAGAPLLRVVRGRPDDAELAALTAVVAARLRAAAAGAPAGAEGPASRWADPAHRLGVVVPAADAWRTSGWAAR